MWNAEIDQGRDRPSVTRIVPLPASVTTPLVANAPDRVALFLRIGGAGNMTCGVGNNPAGADTININGNNHMVLDLTVAQHGTVVNMPWFVNNLTVVGAAFIIETFDKGGRQP